MNAPAAPTIEQKLALEVELANLTSEISGLEKRKNELDGKVAALSNANRDKMRTAQDAFIARHGKRFEDIDLGAAIIGLGGEHVFKIKDIAFMLAVPSGEHQRQVQAFAMDPTMIVDQMGQKVKVNLGPIEHHEMLLLQWVTKFQPPMVGGKPIALRNFANVPIASRLAVLRPLPLPLLGAVADECQTMNSYVNIFLERELGN